MKKTIIFLTLCILMVVFSGCSNTAEIYYDDVKLASYNDSFISRSLLSSTINRELTVKAVSINGSKTIWKYTAKDDDVTFSYSLSVFETGKAKLILVTPEKEIIILSENVDHSVSEVMQTQTFSLTKGVYRVKLVGVDSPKILLKFTADSGVIEWD